MIRKTIAAALLASAASMAPAQPAQPSQPAAAPPAMTASAPDAARVAAARRLVDAAVPPALLEQAFTAGMRSEMPEPPAAAASPRDPHHAERMRIRHRVTLEEGARALREIDPEFRAAFANFYARRMDAAALDQSASWYASPGGRRFMAGAFTLAMSPDYQRSNETLAPIAAAAVEGIEQRFAAATAGLPPIPGMPTPSAAAPATPARPRAAPPTPRPSAGPAIDPARLAAGRRAVDAVWPSEIFRRPLDLRPVAETLIAMKVGEFGFPIPANARIDPNATVTQIASVFDTAFLQRVPVMTRFAGEELARITTAIEPEWKRITAEAYAREFSVAELDDATRFFASPAGRQLIVESMRAMEDPGLVRDMIRMVPRFMSQFAAIEQRVEQATAHLPLSVTMATPVDDGED